MWWDKRLLESPQVIPHSHDTGFFLSDRRGMAQPSDLLVTFHCTRPGACFLDEWFFINFSRAIYQAIISTVFLACTVRKRVELFCNSRISAMRSLAAAYPTCYYPPFPYLQIHILQEKPVNVDWTLSGLELQLPAIPMPFNRKYSSKFFVRSLKISLTIGCSGMSKFMARRVYRFLPYSWNDWKLLFHITSVFRWTFPCRSHLY